MTGAQRRDLRRRVARAGGSASARVRQQAYDVIADLLCVSAEIPQHSRCHAPVLALETEQDVLGADMAVPEALRFGVASSSACFARGVNGI
jgi:hypothetical protein